MTKGISSALDPSTASECRTSQSVAPFVSYGGSTSSELSVLPNGWCVTTLAEVGSWRGGGTPSKSNSSYWTGGSVPWVSPKDMKSHYIKNAIDYITQKAVQESATQLITEGSILIVTRSGILERTLPVGINTVPVAINQDIKALTPNGVVLPAFMASFLRANEATILRSCSKRGTTVASVDLEKLKAVRVAVPPLNEQNRIVKRIEDLQSRSNRAREALESIPSLIEKLRQSVLASAFRGDLTKDWREKNKEKIEPASELLKRIRIERRKKWEEDQLKKFETSGKTPKDDKWREKYKEPKPVDTVGLVELPESWCWASVSEVASVSLGRQRSPQHHSGPNMRKYIRAANITWNGWRLDDVNEMNFDERDFQRFKLQKGDVLINEGSGSRTEIGKPAIWDDQIADCCFQNTLVMARPDLPMSEFLYYCFLHAALRGLFVPETQGINIAHIGREGLATFLIALPPMDEQKLIVQMLAKIEQVCSEFSKCLTKSVAVCESLNQSILTKAFRGELVAQEPENESASALLECIRAEQANALKASFKDGQNIEEKVE